MNEMFCVVRRAILGLLLSATFACASQHARAAGPSDLPVYDHIVIVMEENKDYQQIVGSPAAPYINGTLVAQGADLTKMYAEEHHSEGNYFWLLSGSNQNVGHNDKIPESTFSASNLAQQLITAGLSFKGYSEDLPAIGSNVSLAGLYARKHVPWVSFSNIPHGTTVADSSNLRFEDFPSDYSKLPTISCIVPNLVDDMHNGGVPASVTAGDKWLQTHLDGYYQWAKSHNSLLIVTFDENDHGPAGLTDPADTDVDGKNRIPTIFAGAHIKHGQYAEGVGVTHVNILRTFEAMYKLPKSGAQQKYALAAGISDDLVITDIFDAKN